MTKEQLTKEAEEYIKKNYILYSISGNDIDLMTQAYLASAEPREKRIAELKEENAELRTDLNNHFQADNYIVSKIYDELETLRKENAELTDKVTELEARIEKLIDFVLSKTECCDVCPITDTCINSEGTCPYASIFAKGEEEVTREWLMQFISKGIKEK